jgi:glycopeptide antibiotics resistance protein
MNNRKQNPLTIGLFVIYLIAITWIILFKVQISLEDISHLRDIKLRDINLIPFYDPEIKIKTVFINDIIYNILVYVPFGIYLCLMETRLSNIKKIICFFIVSLFFETLQYILAIGTSNITDIINNTIGGIAGIGIYNMVKHIFKNSYKKALNLLSLIATILMILFFIALKARILKIIF